jgi:hypothetical protein
VPAGAEVADSLAESPEGLLRQAKVDLPSIARRTPE